MSLNVFITGATGYIGGQVLYELLNNKDGKNYNVTALVRSQQKGDNLAKATGNKVKYVIGSLDDADLIAQQVDANDIIINTANVDHVPSAEVLRKSLAELSNRKILIHTSGTSVLGDGLSESRAACTKVYSDAKDIDEINSLAPEQPHRPVDAIVLDTHELNPLVQTAIVCPSTIFGVSDGYDNKLSIQAPELIRLSVKLGQAFSVYSGDGIWNHIHIKDLGTLYYLILAKLLNHEDIPVNRKGYYFGSYSIADEGPVTAEPSRIEHTWASLSAKVGEKLNTRGYVETATVVGLSPDAIVSLKENDEFAPYYWGTNSRSRADNGYAIGWKPQYEALNHFYDAIDEEIDFLERAGKLKPANK